MNRQSLKLFLSTIISAFIIVCHSSCINNSETLYYRYKSINTDGWKSTDTIKFELNDSMICGKCKTEIGIRHTESYPYRDIWLEFSYPVIIEREQDKGHDNNDSINSITHDTDIIVYRTDTLHLYLANERGNWNGSGTTGGYYQFVSEGPVLDLNARNHIDSVTIQQYMYRNMFYKNDTSRLIRINHIMSDSILKNITDVGIRIMKE